MKRTMVITYISNNELNDILNLTEEKGRTEGIEVYEGVLNDNFIFWEGDHIEVDGITREYATVESVFATSQSVDLKLTLTDDIQVLNDFKDSFDFSEEE